MPDISKGDRHTHAHEQTQGTWGDVLALSRRRGVLLLLLPALPLAALAYCQDFVLYIKRIKYNYILYIVYMIHYKLDLI
jgi:hypothetical protein